MFQTVNPEERAALSLRRSAVWPPSVIFTVLFLGFLREKFPRPVVLPRASVFPQALSRHDLIRLHTVPLWPTQCLCLFPGLKKKGGVGVGGVGPWGHPGRPPLNSKTAMRLQKTNPVNNNTLQHPSFETMFPLCSTTDFIFKRTNTAHCTQSLELYVASQARVEQSNTIRRGQKKKKKIVNPLWKLHI